MPDIFDEVEQDLRAERARRLLLRYGGLGVALLIAIVAGVAGYEAWRWHDTKHNAETGERFLAAVKAADLPPGPGRDAARAQFDDVIRTGGRGYRTLALLRKAALLSESGDRAGASALWDQVSGDGAADPAVRDLATVHWALANLDTADPATVQARLGPLTGPTNPWHGLAQEAQALLDLRQGKTEQARDTLRLLAQDTGAPEGVRRRASGLLEQIGPAPGESKAAKVGGS